jgi:hypothetical protein
MIELEVIDNLFLGIAPHFFIVMFIFIKDPFKVGIPSPNLFYFHIFLSFMIILTRSSLLFPLTTAKVSFLGLIILFIFNSS